MDYLFSFIFLFFSSESTFSALSPTECGLYEIVGTIEKNPTKTGYVFYLNKGTNSEFRFLVPHELNLKISPYVERTSKAKVLFLKPLEGYEGQIRQIEHIEYTIPNHLRDKAIQTLSLISKRECSK